MPKYIHKLTPGGVTTYKRWLRDSRPVVAVLNPPSRVKAKKDKHAVQMARLHATPYKTIPDYAMRNAGHVNRFSGRIEDTRQFV